MTAHNPLPCSNAMMSSASTAGARIVLLDTGNYPGVNNWYNTTWDFTGTDWAMKSSSLLDPAGPLPCRSDAICCQDGIGVILYGGKGQSETDGVLQDTWRWNGTSWSVLTPTTVPYGRYGANAAYLAGTGLVMFGGGIANGTILNESWIWNGTNWNQTVIANGAGPIGRINHMMAASTTQVLMYGG